MDVEDLGLGGQLLSLGSDAYELAAEVRAGHVLSVREPFPVSFNPVALTELD